MHTDLVRPCRKCPFRTDVEPYIRHDRAKEIAKALMDDKTFSCHETVDYSNEDDDGLIRSGERAHCPSHNEQHCAGALIVLERMERPNQWMCWMARLEMYDRTQLEMDSPVVKNLREFVNKHKP